MRSLCPSLLRYGGVEALEKSFQQTFLKSAAGAEGIGSKTVLIAARIFSIYSQ